MEWSPPMTIGIAPEEQDKVFERYYRAKGSEGSDEGKGLGLKFLRHIERTRVICHVIDIAPVEGRSPAESYHAIRHELEAYSRVLAAKPEIVVANKMDLEPDRELLRAFNERRERHAPAI